MNMKLNLPVIAIASIMLIGSGDALAHHRDHDRHGYRDSGRVHHVDYRNHRQRGKVIKVKPIYREVSVPVKKRNCRGRHRDDIGGAVAGGLIGGIIGNQIADRGDRAALTVVGALLGGFIGNEIHDDNRKGHRHSRDCTIRTRHETRREVVGYKVKYRYRGEIYKTRTNRHPGKFIRVNRADRLAWR